MLMTMFKSPPKKGEEERPARLRAPDLVTLLVRRINELVFFIQSDRFVPAHANIRL